jgi:hypothetical protein
MRHDLVSQKRQPRARHDDDHVKFICFESLHKADGVAMVVERTLLDRWRYKWIATLPADERFHLLRTAAFQAENAESCKWHVSERDRTFPQFKT